MWLCKKWIWEVSKNFEILEKFKPQKAKNKEIGSKNILIGGSVKVYRIS